MRFSEVFDAKRAPLIVLVTHAHQSASRGYNLPISSTNLKLLT